jgi:hypothetical protein
MAVACYLLRMLVRFVLLHVIKLKQLQGGWRRSGACWAAELSSATVLLQTLVHAATGSRDNCWCVQSVLSGNLASDLGLQLAALFGCSSSSSVSGSSIQLAAAVANWLLKRVLQEVVVTFCSRQQLLCYVAGMTASSEQSNVWVLVVHVLVLSVDGGEQQQTCCGTAAARSQVVRGLVWSQQAALRACSCLGKLQIQEGSPRRVCKVLASVFVRAPLHAPTIVSKLDTEPIVLVSLSYKIVFRKKEIIFIIGHVPDFCCYGAKT